MRNKKKSQGEFNTLSHTINEWRKTLIDGLESNSKGEIRRSADHKILKQSNINGYRSVNYNKKNYLVHRLVCSAFDPQSEQMYEFLVVNHRDSNRKNNSPDNLEWCSLQVNSKLPRRKAKKGVLFFPHGTKQWRVVSKLKGKTFTAGYFKSFEEAQKIYAIVHRIIYGAGPDEKFSAALLSHPKLDASTIRKMIKKMAA